ncbi:lipase family alpha/beta hydrolase [Streptomyces sp. NPDC058405]|uniref:lipase family alpha/beta hydrolase n=1 Tax=Streptomyces sp. NPDC058405 TaxID=3346482 RepID=UPI003655A25B
MKHDLVVFVPGITGSRLTRDGKDMWELSKQALLQLRHPGRLLKDFQLPPGIGDARPEGPHALRADHLIKAPNALPGLFTALASRIGITPGYPDVRPALKGLHKDQFLPFPYDWRLSNRLSAADLQEKVERALSLWRERARTLYPGHDEPKVVFLCHSMGGLIARYYLEVLGGREIARTLVTIGTPHRGAAKTVKFLTGHAIDPHPGKGPVRDLVIGKVAERYNPQVAELCRTFPSIAQLLPVYDAVREPGKTRLQPLEDVTVPELGSELVRDVFAFQREFTDAQERNEADGKRPYKVYALGGRNHPTVHGVILAPEKLDFPISLNDDQEWTGDGTVPEESAFAKWALDDMGDAIWNGYRHAGMAGEESVEMQLVNIFQGKSARATLAGGSDFGVEVPDLAVEGEPFEIVAVGAEADRGVRVRLSAPGQPETPEVPLTPDGAGNLRGELVSAAGTWVLEVVADHPRVVHRDVVLVAGG